MTAKTRRSRIDLIGGPLCGSQDEFVELDAAGGLPAVTHDRYQNAGSIRRGFALYVWEPFLIGLPRPKRAKQCCEFPGRGCPTYGPEQTT